MTSGRTTDATRSTTIIQPVPLGNPPSNSGEQPTPTNNQQNQLVPVIPVAPTPTTPNNTNNRP
ncbi:MAG: hypothetical protein LH472_08315 [Pyrinomonadaceae bacterium]|nr:hypothetical protein [Pyrinomonadaceae bacterium]